MEGTATCMKSGAKSLIINIPVAVMKKEQLAPGWVVKFDITNTGLYRKPDERKRFPRAAPEQPQK